MKKQKVFYKDIEIRARDLNRVGHVANPVYFSYFDEGWLAFYKEVLKRSLNDMSIATILINVTCTFLKPIFLEDHLTLQVWVGNIGVKSFTFKYRLVDRKDENIVFAEAESILSCYDYQALNTIPIPEDMVEKFKEYGDIS